MIMKFNFGESHKKILLLFGLWWVIGVIIAAIWGLGWFFLIETVRRIVTYFPPLRARLRRLIFGLQPEPDKVMVSATTNIISQVMGWIIIGAWIGLTVFVFMKANISFFTILEFLQSAR